MGVCCHKYVSSIFTWVYNCKSTYLQNTIYIQIYLQILDSFLLGEKIWKSCAFCRLNRIAFTVKSPLKTAVSINYFENDFAKETSIWGRLLLIFIEAFYSAINGTFWQFKTYKFNQMRLLIKGGLYFSFFSANLGAVTIWGRFLFKGGF